MGVGLSRKGNVVSNYGMFAARAGAPTLPKMHLFFCG